MADSLDFRTIRLAELARQIRSKERSAREVTEHAIERLQTLNERINAFVSVDIDRARRDAASIDERIVHGDDPGALAGIPVGVKDLEAVEGFVTTFGSAVRANDAPATMDCVHINRMRRAGAIILGKTNTPEYGHKGLTDNPLFGDTRNPWSLDHTPGGSSGGSAAALAAGIVPLATGTDGGGSIRIPASVCGLSGIKTEAGRIPITGDTMPGSGLLSTNGPMANRIEDSAWALDVVIGHNGQDPLSLPHPGSSWYDATMIGAHTVPKRVVWSPTMGHAIVDREVAAACRAAVEKLAAAGTEVIEIERVFDADPVDAWMTLWAVARYKAQGHLIGTSDWDRLSPSIQPQILAGEKISGLDYARAHDAMYALNIKLDAALGHAPLLLCPTAAGQAPRIGEDGTIDGQASLSWVQLTYGINMTRNPAATTPVGLTSAGIPIGLQVIGNHHDEAGVMAAVAGIENVIGFTMAPTRAPFKRARVWNRGCR
jgi:aspartyl-tRNA(Asn)/glutamyl-tRNA(Gln) amidotransferase subunit A